MVKVRTSIPVAVLFALGACASVPHAPSVAVLPGGGKSMEVFNTDDIACRGLSAQRAFDKGKPSDGMGLGNTHENDNSFTAQQRYDTAYLKCMFSKGHQVPVNLNMTS